MSEQTDTTITVGFEITDWRETPYDEPADGPRLTRATVGKRYEGALAGISVAELLTAQGDDGNGYVASERVAGALEGRTGTFVLLHGGIVDAGGQRSFGHVVPGSGTGELRGLRGTASFTHDEAGARLTFSYAL